MTIREVAGPKFLCRCLRCDETREIPLPLTRDNATEAVLPWIFSLIDPPAVAQPRLGLMCDGCAKRIYGVEFYEESVAHINTKKPN